MKEVKQKQHALTLPFLDAIFPSSESEAVLRPAQSSIPCYFSASTTLNYLVYLYHNKLWYSQELKHFTISVEGKEMSPRELKLLENTLSYPYKIIWHPGPQTMGSLVSSQIQRTAGHLRSHGYFLLRIPNFAEFSISPSFHLLILTPHSPPLWCRLDSPHLPSFLKHFQGYLA